MKKSILSLVGFMLLAGSLFAAEPSVVFEDTFKGKLGEGWTWLRENPKAWRIADDALELRIEPGDAWTLRAYVVNEGKKPIRVGGVTVATTVNGAGSGAPVPSRAREIAPQQRVQVAEATGWWRAAKGSAAIFPACPRSGRPWPACRARSWRRWRSDGLS